MRSPTVRRHAHAERDSSTWPRGAREESRWLSSRARRASGASALLALAGCGGISASGLLLSDGPGEPADAATAPPVQTVDSGGPVGAGSLPDAAAPPLDGGEVDDAGEAADASAPDEPDEPDGAAAGDDAQATDDGGERPDADAGSPVTTPLDAGPPAEACPLAGEAVTMIDDGSSPGANATILPQCGRAGDWFVFNDGVSTQTPAAGAPFGPFLTATPPNQVTGYVRTRGTLSVAATATAAQPHWGGGLGFNLHAENGAAVPYDVGSLGDHGFSFWVRVTAKNKIPSVHFYVQTAQTAGYADGAYYGYVFDVPPRGAWTKVSVAFTALVQPSWTPPAERVPFDPTAVTGLQWSFESGAKQALAFDVAIGDVELW